MIFLAPGHGGCCGGAGGGGKATALPWRAVFSLRLPCSVCSRLGGEAAVPREKELAGSPAEPDGGASPAGLPCPATPAAHPASYFFPQHHLDVAADLAQGSEERVAEGADAERVDVADALDLDQVALDAGHHRPDVAEGDAGEQEAPEQGQRDPQQCGQQAVAPVLGDGEGGVAHLPHAIKTVGAHGLRDHVFEIHLQGWEGEPSSHSSHPLLKRQNPLGGLLNQVAGPHPLGF